MAERGSKRVTKLFRNISVLLILGLLCLPAVPSADTAQYFYDELGRLVGVVDEFADGVMV